MSVEDQQAQTEWEVWEEIKRSGLDLEDSSVEGLDKWGLRQPGICLLILV